MKASALVRDPLLLIAALVSCAALATRAAETVLHVDLMTPAGEVNRMVLGSNVLAHLHAAPKLSAEGAGLWRPQSSSPNGDMVRMARTAGVSTLRWPGGCAAHEYDWKLAVGPRAKRPRQAFGLPEFLRLAEAIGAVPIITLAEYRGDASDAADLVEYLNAPVGAGKEGGADWAALRAADGHPQPYGVVWFEYGNETWHGSHPGTEPAFSTRKMDAQTYVRRYAAYRSAMRRVDPSIKLGAVIDNESLPQLSSWSRTVIAGTGDVADFFVYHAYLPRVDRDDATAPETLFTLALAAPVQLDAILSHLSSSIERIARRRIPLAVTEFNAHLVQERPVPYRFTLGAAVEMADFVRVLLDPRHAVAHAQYWHLSNEYWGMVKGYSPPYTLRPAYLAFRLYNEHLGERLVPVSVQGDSYEEPGGLAVAPARARGSGESLGMAKTLNEWTIDAVAGAAARQEADGRLMVEISGDGSVNYHQSGITVAAAPLQAYRVTAEMRAEGLTGHGAQIEVGDERGWSRTKSTALSEEVMSSAWTPVQVDYRTLPDAKALRISARRLGGTPSTGRFWVRNVAVQPLNRFTLPAIPYVAAIATRSADRVAIFVVNRRLDGPSPIRVDVAGRTPKAWTLTGPSVDATNETSASDVRISDLSVDALGGQIRAILPPHSFTVIEFTVEANNGRAEK